MSHKTTYRTSYETLHPQLEKDSNLQFGVIATYFSTTALSAYVSRIILNYPLRRSSVGAIQGISLHNIPVYANVGSVDSLSIHYPSFQFCIPHHSYPQCPCS
jgi:hypothetical protein